MKLDKEFIMKFAENTGYTFIKSEAILKHEINRFTIEEENLVRKDPDHVICWEGFKINLKRYYKKS